MTQQNDKLPWFKEGLRFQCTQCGQCCTGGPGYVWVTDEDIATMAQFLNLSIELFRRKYIRRRDNRDVLVEKKNEARDCIFLKDRKCELYQSRPAQCRSFPWWQENLNSEESWKMAALHCEGINDQAPIVPFDVIMENLS